MSYFLTVLAKAATGELGFASKERFKGVKVMRHRVIPIAMILLAVGSTCLGRAQTPEAKVVPAEINVWPIRDMVSDLSAACANGGSGAEVSHRKVFIAFAIDPDGSVPKSGLKIVQSSGSEVIDAMALQLLSKFGESHILGVISTLSTTTIEFKAEAGAIHLTINGVAPSPEEADIKASSLKFLFRIVGATQRTKNPVVADLLGRFAIGTYERRVIADMSLSCNTLDEILKHGSTHFP
jgi:hypothetical protein